LAVCITFYILAIFRLATIKNLYFLIRNLNQSIRNIPNIIEAIYHTLKFSNNVRNNSIRVHWMSLLQQNRKLPKTEQYRV
jgi:hypothetical protein